MMITPKRRTAQWKKDSDYLRCETQIDSMTGVIKAAFAEKLVDLL
jgi:hypothetical protein